MYTKKTANILALILPLFVVVFASCGGAQHRKEGMEALRKIQADVHGLAILVSAGLTKAEYSQRLEDLLLKAGDLNESESQMVPKFPKKEQDTVKEIYGHLSESIAAYKTARDYFGEKFSGVGCDEGCMTLSQQDYDDQKLIFPNLAYLQPVKFLADLYPNSPPEYFRDSMLQALWKIAGDEETVAKQMFDTMGQQ